MIDIAPLMDPWYVKNAGPGFPVYNTMTPTCHLPGDIVGVSDVLTKLSTPVRDALGLLLSPIQDEVLHLTFEFTVDGLRKGA